MAATGNSLSPSSTHLGIAFERFKQSVIPSDAVAFQNATLDDVWKEATDIQENQRNNETCQNIRRLEPFLHGIEKYTKSLEVICNGTPYVAWIWGPIKLMLQLASEFSNVFEKLLDAYRQIAENMPHFDKLKRTFSDDENFKSILVMIYIDITDFHRRAYKFFRRRKWHIFFDAFWKNFESRFNSILEKLARHKTLLMSAAISIDVTEARTWRLKEQEELKERQKRRKWIQLRDSIAWLHVEDERQEDEVERLSQLKQAGTGRWIFGNSQLLSWINEDNVEPILWLKGIPGAGKSVLCTSIIEYLKEEKPNITTAYYLCNSYTSGRDVLAKILRSITAQILQSNKDNKTLVPFVFENYANNGLPPSIKTMKKLLTELLSTVDNTRICIDGLDECKDEDQKLILQELVALSKLPGEHCRVLFSNRESTQINKFMFRKRTISLKEESINVEEDVKIYVEEKLTTLRSRDTFTDQLIEEVKGKVVKKAEGMFLWVRLVFVNLDECYSVAELKDAVERLPNGLREAYGRILDRIKELNPASYQKAIRMLQWMACSFRTLKLYELQDGIVLHPGNLILNENTKIDNAGILDLCKPIIEETRGNKVDFVHYSAKEFILHLESGPFLKDTEAHYQIAFSCIRYLSTSSCFYNISVTEDMLKIRVIRRFHGLHHYASNFWFKHLLEAARLPSALDTKIVEVTKQLLPFWKKDPNINPDDAVDDGMLDEVAIKEGLSGKLEVLHTLPEIRWMVHEMLSFRAVLDNQLDPSKTPEELKAVELKHDPTHFSAVSKCYQEMVESLMICSTTNLPGSVSAQEHQKFKSTYSGSAFLCRSIECSHSIDGFPTEAARTNHETSKHVTLLRCADPSCEFYVSGFANRRSLARHNRRFHPEPDALELPTFGIPIPPPSEDEDSETVSPAAAASQVRYTPVRGRISKARKGLPVHICEICQPPKVFTRDENLRRHFLTHQKPMFPCTSGCTKAFYRHDQLARHLKAHEKKASNPPKPKRRRLDSSSTTILTSGSATPNSSSQDSMPIKNGNGNGNGGGSVKKGPINAVVEGLKHTDSTNTNASASSVSLGAQTLGLDESMSTSVSESDENAEMV